MVQITLFKHYAPGFRGEQDWGWRDRSGCLKRGRWMDGKERRLVPEVEHRVVGKTGRNAGKDKNRQMPDHICSCGGRLP